MTDEKMLMKKPHNVILEDRKNLTITGVQDIDSLMNRWWWPLPTRGS